jgi:hypothetical protein
MVGLDACAWFIKRFGGSACPASKRRQSERVMKWL